MSDHDALQSRVDALPEQQLRAALSLLIREHPDAVAEVLDRIQEQT